MGYELETIKLHYQRYWYTVDDCWFIFFWLNVHYQTDLMVFFVFDNFYGW